MTKKTRTESPVAEICLYGTRKTGAGWIACVADGRMAGDGEPVLDRSFTEAVWLAVAAIRDLGVAVGLVAIHDTGGERSAEVRLSSVPSYGQISWHASTPLVVDAAAISAASTEP